MKAPISWLKEYTKITKNINDLMWEMTEIGLTTEHFDLVDKQKVLDIEVTPNRPDWLSILGIAREISIIENSNFKPPKIKELPEKTKNLPINVAVDKKLVGRYSAVTMSGVKVGSSPKWMQERLKLVGLRPINNLVDITNYVMIELGIPIHAFDYDKFLSQKLKILLSKGGEKFVSVDEIKYKLPKNALIIKDKDRVIDLAGIKGGANTGISKGTKNIYIHIPIYDPVIIRRTSQKLKLASEASYIYERGPDLGGTMNTLRRVVHLIKEYAGGEIASHVIDISKENHKEKILILNEDKLISILGINTDKNEVTGILRKLGIDTTYKNNKFSCKIPTRRSDISFEEDLIEEVARIKRYNNFSRTLPYSNVTTIKNPYFYDFDFELKIKNLAIATGFTEVKTLALTSEENIKNCLLNLDNHIKIVNPVSLEYEYLRTTLIPHLVMAYKLNSNECNLKVFEYDKVYYSPVDKAQEKYKLSGVIRNAEYRQLKGVVDFIIERLNINTNDTTIKATAVKKGMWHPIRSGVIEIGNKSLGTLGELNPVVKNNLDIADDLLFFELDIESLKKLSNIPKYKSVPIYPPQIEDVTLIVKKGKTLGNIIKSINETSKYISSIKLLDTYKNSFTLRIFYQHPTKTFTDKEVEKIRKSYLKTLKNKYSVKLK
jgi:phenylalanyl-tRNA synthetase beta chain